MSQQERSRAVEDISLSHLKLEESGQLFLMNQSVKHICQTANPHKVVAKQFERKPILKTEKGSEQRPKEVYENMQADLVQDSNRKEILISMRYSEICKLLEIKYFISFQEFTTLLRSERLEIEEHMPTYQ
ncbi:hypothetical protein ISCGN_030043 [Ixodes scapularis]